VQVLLLGPVFAVMVVVVVVVASLPRSPVPLLPMVLLLLLLLLIDSVAHFGAPLVPRGPHELGHAVD
jgi:hypothetical protein